MNLNTVMPQYILDRAYCVIMLPGVKKANAWIFSGGFGGTFGRGAMTCRTSEKFEGPWGAPTMVALKGVTWGLALGGASTDILILVMNEKGCQGRSVAWQRHASGSRKISFGHAE
jgi:lipid-binding SYLF domain-containing protein